MPGGSDVAKARKVIITCAVTGAIHSPSMSPYLPVTPDEIIANALGAAEAGAAILHLHARNPELKAGLGLTVLMAEQNFKQAIRIADRGYVLVHGEIALHAASMAELQDSDVVRKLYLGVG
jgi:uncharacterized protein (DUF849 family)